jgi:HAD superfamily hydrolase (TIGR01509 family)
MMGMPMFFLATIPYMLVAGSIGSVLMIGTYSYLFPRSGYQQLDQLLKGMGAIKVPESLEETKRRFFNISESNNLILIRRAAQMALKVADEFLRELLGKYEVFPEQATSFIEMTTPSGNPYVASQKISGRVPTKTKLAYSYLKFGRYREIQYFSEALVQNILKKLGDNLKKDSDSWIIVNPGGAAVPNSAFLLAREISSRLRLPHLALHAPLAMNRSAQNKLASWAREPAWNVHLQGDRWTDVSLKGKRVIYIDDSVLSGSIMDAGRDFLKKVGAKTVDAFVVTGLEDSDRLNFEKIVDQSLLTTFSVDPLSEILNYSENAFTTRSILYTFQRDPENFADLLGHLTLEARLNLYLYALEYFGVRGHANLNALILNIENAVPVYLLRQEDLKGLASQFFDEVARMIREEGGRVREEAAVQFTTRINKLADHYRTRGNIRFAFFDFDKTLINTKAYYDAIRKASVSFLSERARLPAPEIEKKILHLKNGLKLEGREMQRRHIAEAFGIPPHLLTREILRRVNTKELLTPDPKLIAVLRNLRQKQIRLAILSNNDPLEINAALDAIGLTGFFEQVITPVDGTGEKPDQSLFRHALKKMGAEVSHTLMIGDSLTSDIYPAEALGMQVCLIRSRADLEDLPSAIEKMTSRERLNATALKAWADLSNEFFQGGFSNDQELYRLERQFQAMFSGFFGRATFGEADWRDLYRQAFDYFYAKEVLPEGSYISDFTIRADKVIKDLSGYAGRLQLITRTLSDKPHRVYLGMDGFFWHVADGDAQWYSMDGYSLATREELHLLYPFVGRLLPEHQSIVYKVMQVLLKQALESSDSGVKFEEQLWSVFSREITDGNIQEQLADDLEKQIAGMQQGENAPYTVAQRRQFLQGQVRLLRDHNILKEKATELGEDFRKRISSSIPAAEGITIIDKALFGTQPWFLKLATRVVNEQDGVRIGLKLFVGDLGEKYGKRKYEFLEHVDVGSQIETIRPLRKYPWRRKDPLLPVLTLNTPEQQLQGFLLAALFAGRSEMREQKTEAGSLEFVARQLGIDSKKDWRGHGKKVFEALVPKIWALVNQQGPWDNTQPPKISLEEVHKLGCAVYQGPGSIEGKEVFIVLGSKRTFWEALRSIGLEPSSELGANFVDVAAGLGENIEQHTNSLGGLFVVRDRSNHRAYLAAVDAGEEGFFGKESDGVLRIIKEGNQFRKRPGSPGAGVMLGDIAAYHGVKIISHGQVADSTRKRTIDGATRTVELIPEAYRGPDAGIVAKLKGSAIIVDSMSDEDFVVGERTHSGMQEVVFIGEENKVPIIRQEDGGYLVDSVTQTVFYNGRTAKEFLDRTSVFKDETQVVVPSGTEASVTVSGETFVLSEPGIIGLSHGAEASVKVTKGNVIVLTTRTAPSWYGRSPDDSGKNSTGKVWSKGGVVVLKHSDREDWYGLKKGEHKRTVWMSDSTASPFPQSMFPPIAGVSRVEFPGQKGILPFEVLRPEEHLHLHPVREGGRQLLEIYQITRGKAALLYFQKSLEGTLHPEILVLQPGDLAAVRPGTIHDLLAVETPYEHVVTFVPSVHQYGFSLKENVEYAAIGLTPDVKQELVRKAEKALHDFSSLTSEKRSVNRAEMRSESDQGMSERLQELNSEIQKNMKDVPRQEKGKSLIAFSDAMGEALNQVSESDLHQQKIPSVKRGLFFMREQLWAKAFVREADIFKLHRILANSNKNFQYRQHELHDFVFETDEFGDRRMVNDGLFALSYPLIPEQMGVFLSYLNGLSQSHSEADPLLTAAEIYQRFVWMHPFFDYNARTASLLATYYLAHRGYPGFMGNSISMAAKRTVKDLAVEIGSWVLRAAQEMSSRSSPEIQTRTTPSGEKSARSEMRELAKPFVRIKKPSLVSTPLTSVAFEGKEYSLDTIRRYLQNEKQSEWFKFGILLFDLLPYNQKEEFIVSLPPETQKDLREYLAAPHHTAAQLIVKPLKNQDFTARFAGTVHISIGDNFEKSLRRESSEKVRFEIGFGRNEKLALKIVFFGEGEKDRVVSYDLEVDKTYMVSREQIPEEHIEASELFTVSNQFLTAGKHFSFRVFLKDDETWLTVRDFKSTNGTMLAAEVYPGTVVYPRREENLIFYKTYLEKMIIECSDSKQADHLPAGVEKTGSLYEKALQEAKQLYLDSAEFPELEELRKKLIKDYMVSDAVGLNRMIPNAKGLYHQDQSQARARFAMRMLELLLEDGRIAVWEPVLEVTKEYMAIFVYLVQLLETDKIQSAPSRLQHEIFRSLAHMAKDAKPLYDTGIVVDQKEMSRTVRIDISASDSSRSETRGNALGVSVRLEGRAGKPISQEADAAELKGWNEAMKSWKEELRKKPVQIASKVQLAMKPETTLEVSFDEPLAFRHSGRTVLFQRENREEELSFISDRKLLKSMYDLGTLEMVGAFYLSDADSEKMYAVQLTEDQKLLKLRRLPDAFDTDAAKLPDVPVKIRQGRIGNVYTVKLNDLIQTLGHDAEHLSFVIQGAVQQAINQTKSRAEAPVQGSMTNISNQNRSEARVQVAAFEDDLDYRRMLEKDRQYTHADVLMRPEEKVRKTIEKLRSKITPAEFKALDGKTILVPGFGEHWPELEAFAGLFPASKIVGVDWLQRCVDLARKNVRAANVEIIQDDIRSWSPAGRPPIGLIFVSYVLEHSLWEDNDEVLKRLVRTVAALVADNGFLITIPSTQYIVLPEFKKLGFVPLHEESTGLGTVFIAKKMVAADRGAASRAEMRGIKSDRRPETIERSQQPGGIVQPVPNVPGTVQKNRPETRNDAVDRAYHIKFQEFQNEPREVIYPGGMDLKIFEMFPNLEAVHFINYNPFRVSYDVDRLQYKIPAGKNVIGQEAFEQMIRTYRENIDFMYMHEGFQNPILYNEVIRSSTPQIGLEPFILDDLRRKGAYEINVTDLSENGEAKAYKISFKNALGKMRTIYYHEADVFFEDKYPAALREILKSKRADMLFIKALSSAGSFSHLVDGLRPGALAVTDKLGNPEGLNQDSRRGQRFAVAIGYLGGPLSPWGSLGYGVSLDYSMTVYRIKNARLEIGIAGTVLGTKRTGLSNKRSEVREIDGVSSDKNPDRVQPIQPISGTKLRQESPKKEPQDMYTPSSKNAKKDAGIYTPASLREKATALVQKLPPAQKPGLGTPGRSEQRVAVDVAEGVFRVSTVLAMGKAELRSLLDRLMPNAFANETRDQKLETVATDVLAKAGNAPFQVSVTLNGKFSLNNPVAQSLIEILIRKPAMLVQIVVPGATIPEVMYLRQELTKKVLVGRREQGSDTKGINLVVTAETAEILGFLKANQERALVYNMRENSRTELESLAPKAGKSEALFVFDDVSLGQKAYALLAALDRLFDQNKLPQGVQSAAGLLAANLQIASAAAQEIASAA